MRAQLDTAILLAAPEPRRPGAVARREDGSVLFLAHRAADGWLALDLTGEVLARFRACAGGASAHSREGADGAGPELPVVRGGLAYPDRVFSLYAVDVDPRSYGGLRVPGSGSVKLGFGGDVTSLLRRSVIDEPRAGARAWRLLLFRGLTVLPWRARSVPARFAAARVTPELLFQTPRSALWAEVHRLGAGHARSFAPPAQRSLAELPARRTFSAYGT